MLAQLLTRRLQHRIFVAANKHFRNPIIVSTINKSTNTQQTADTKDALTDEPVKYFGSEAAAWRAKDSRSGGAETALWYQPYVISASLAVFLIYFCILREESDIDRKLEGSLYDHVDGLEEMQLAVSYKYNKENGMDTRDIEKRLQELGIDAKQLDLTQY